MKSTLRLICTCLLAAVVSVPVMSQGLSPTGDRTFFGIKIGEMLRPTRSEYGVISLGSTQFQTDKFVIKRQELPAWATGDMTVDQAVSAEGVRVESVFTVDVFRDYTDKFDKRIHDAKVQELVDMMTTKLGQKPTRGGPWYRNIVNPVDARTPPMVIQYAEWELPWGAVVVIGCAYTSYPHYDCQYDDARPSIIARTTTMVDAIVLLAQRKKEQQQQTEMNRRKF